MQAGFFIGVLEQVSQHTYSVGTAFFLTYLSSIYDVQHLREDVHQGDVLRRVGHVADAECHDAGRWRFHLACEHVPVIPFPHVHAVSLHAFLAVRGREGGNVGFDERADGVGIDVAYEHESEVAGILEAVFVHVHHLLVVDLVDHVGFQADFARVVVVQGGDGRVVECHPRFCFDVLQGSFCPVFIGLESFLVHAWRGERKVGQLHHGFQVFRRTTSADTFFGIAYGGFHIGFLSGQCFFQVDGAEVS